MLRYFLLCCFLLLTAYLSGQEVNDSVEVQSTEYTILYNEAGIGPLIMIPTGIYKTHDRRAQPGISLSYLRYIGAFSRLNNYLGLELNWIDLGTASEDITETGPDGIFEYTSIADIEYVSATFIYRLQPDLEFILWPYVEIGLGPAYFYTVDRERYSIDGGSETEEDFDLVRGSWTTANRFEFGVQYYFHGINSYLDLAWRYSFHGKAEYDTIDKDDVQPNTRPVEYLESRVSRASNQVLKLTFNLLF